MNTREIERFLEADTVSRGVFQGVFSVDTLPRQPPPTGVQYRRVYETRPALDCYSRGY